LYTVQLGGPSIISANARTCWSRAVQ
jgi:hypothetical protein